MPRHKKPKIIHIHGRRWFARTYGNTYHTVTVWLDGVCVIKTMKQYGYGEQFAWTAREWLAENGYLPGIEQHESLRQYCDRKKITYVCEVTDVQREKDL